MVPATNSWCVPIPKTPKRWQCRQIIHSVSLFFWRDFAFSIPGLFWRRGGCISLDGIWDTPPPSPPPRPKRFQLVSPGTTSCIFYSECLISCEGPVRFEPPPPQMTALSRRSKIFYGERSQSDVFALEIAQNHLILISTIESQSHQYVVQCNTHKNPEYMTVFTNNPQSLLPIERLLCSCISDMRGIVPVVVRFSW